MRGLTYKVTNKQQQQYALLNQFDKLSIMRHNLMCSLKTPTTKPPQPGGNNPEVVFRFALTVVIRNYDELGSSATSSDKCPISTL